MLLALPACMLLQGQPDQFLLSELLEVVLLHVRCITFAYVCAVRGLAELGCPMLCYAVLYSVLC
jgi:hypothetical protein